MKMNRQMRILMFALSSLAVVPALAQEAEAPQEAETQAEAKPVEVTPADEIVVEILGLENDTGQIGCRIFSKADGFPTKMKKADEQLYSKPKSKKGGCTFKGYKPGTYAISVMHDLDSSGDLNTSMLGRPKEPWGVSNDAPAHRFGPPEFKECTFKYEGGKKVIKIKLQH
ncbi:MAG: hypothetical protein DRH23_16430 [Deltaproteobacteria bacterium]|nr:DUF2141 domain-containing protein [Deltaproteobacteria bacterium]RLB43360.1 MAG: hypothetical protein DRH23_16430 [Deltaproteobacteria bacterium]